NWNRVETLLALALYFECGGIVPEPDDARVVVLSNLLRGLSFHPPSRRKPSFRNPDGVAFKHQILRHVATGKGLDSTSKTDDAIWRDYGERPEEAKAAAAAIRAAATAVGTSTGIEDDDI